MLKHRFASGLIQVQADLSKPFIGRWMVNSTHVSFSRVVSLKQKEIMTWNYDMELFVIRQEGKAHPLVIWMDHKSLVYRQIAKWLNAHQVRLHRF